MCHTSKDLAQRHCEALLASCRLPEMTSARDREPSLHHMQPQHPQASHQSSSSQHMQQQLHGQQLAQKLQGHDDSDHPSSAAIALPNSDRALAANSQSDTNHQSDRHHQKASHAHFADDDDIAADSRITGRNESITAVRSAAGGESISHAQGTFWKGLDAEGSHRTAAGFCHICTPHIADTCLHLCSSSSKVVSAICSCVHQSSQQSMHLQCSDENGTETLVCKSAASMPLTTSCCTI